MSNGSVNAWHTPVFRVQMEAERMHKITEPTVLLLPVSQGPFLSRRTVGQCVSQRPCNNECITVP